MKIFDLLKNDYFRLFVKREGKVVLGKSYSSLWLLTAVLTATFLAIAFSNASLSYLSYKMDDPFINWVDIQNDYGEGDFIGLQYSLESEYNKEEFHYYSYQKDYMFSFMFFGAEYGSFQYFKCRFFQDMNTPLVKSILGKDNVVKDWVVKDPSLIVNNTVGVIITEEAMRKLGYDEAPAFIGFTGFSDTAQEYGFDFYQTQVKAPVPVLAVVKNLPGNADIVSSSFFYEQISNDYTRPFNFEENAGRYADNLSYFIPNTLSSDKFKKGIAEAAAEFTDAGFDLDELSFYLPEITPFVEGRFATLYFDDYLDYSQLKSLNDGLMEKFSKDGLHRVFNYNFCDAPLTASSFISVHFKDLDKLRDFEKYVRDEFKVKLEMSQINAKENFNAVSAMGNILSWVIIIFAIVCIILFIVNLLQSYFQKVKRNLGTFKAFGISNRALISVYVLIMAAIVLSAILMSVSVTWVIQGLLHVCGILKDGVFDYLSLWSMKTVCSIIIIVAASVYTVYYVMHRLLMSTPGDLIYDRQ